MWVYIYIWLYVYIYIYMIICVYIYIYISLIIIIYLPLSLSVSLSLYNGFLWVSLGFGLWIPQKAMQNHSVVVGSVAFFHPSHTPIPWPQTGLNHPSSPVLVFLDGPWMDSRWKRFRLLSSKRARLWRERKGWGCQIKTIGNPKDRMSSHACLCLPFN